MTAKAPAMLLPGGHMSRRPPGGMSEVSVAALRAARWTEARGAVGPPQLAARRRALRQSHDLGDCHPARVDLGVHDRRGGADRDAGRRRPLGPRGPTRRDWRWPRRLAPRRQFSFAARGARPEFRQQGPKPAPGLRGGAPARGAVGPVAARLRARDLALERFAAERFEFFFLFARQNALGFFVGALAQRADFRLGRLAIAPLDEVADLALRGLLDFAQAVLLFRSERQRLGHRRVIERRGAALLQRDLLEPLELIFLQDAGHGRVVRLGALLHLLLPLGAIEIAQPGQRFALLGGELRNLFRLLLGELELLLHRFLIEQHEIIHALTASESARAAALLSNRVRGNQCHEHPCRDPNP